MLIDEQGLPDFWVTLFLTEDVRPSSSAWTMEHTIRDITHLKLWEEIHGRDLISEFSKGRFLDDEDIYSIRDHCMLDARDLRKRMQVRLNSNAPNVSTAFPITARAVDVVGPDHFKNRLTRIADFLSFTARAMLRRRANFVELGEQIKNMKARLIAQKENAQTNRGLANDPDLKAPPPKVFEQFMKTVHENSADNPYKNPSVRYRNALIFELMYETGMRAGEVLATRIEDIDFHEAAVKVIRQHDSLEDPRNRQPVAKTLERRIPIKKELVQRLRIYVMDVRAHIPGASKHPFLFVTHKRGIYSGRPISNSTFSNRILGAATKRYPELYDEINRHGFRHNFNYRLSKKIDAHNKKAKYDESLKRIGEKEEIQIRKQLCGWISDDTANIYNRRHIKEVADKLMREDMKEQSKHIKGK